MVDANLKILDTIYHQLQNLYNIVIIPEGAKQTAF